MALPVSATTHATGAIAALSEIQLPFSSDSGLCPAEWESAGEFDATSQTIVVS
jgi:hypothetical protein